MTKIARHVLFGCCIVLAVSVFSAKPLLGQRAWHQGDTWLKWSQAARESYVLGFLEGSTADHEQSRGQSSDPQILEVNTSQMVKSITDFYRRYPEDRDIYIREVIEQLRKGLTLEQIHNYPFWRHQASRQNLGTDEK